MSISSLTSSAASQLAYTSRLSGTSSTTSSSGTQRTGDRPPPPPDDGGGLISAIADALKSIGVSGTSSDASTEATATDDTASTGTDTTANAAQALGTFLESLMGALHAQQGEDGEAPPYGEPPQGGPGMGGGPGKLSSDLQSLIAELGAGTTTDEADDTTATSTDGTDTSVSTLQSSFKDLLTALGGDGSDASAQLSSFLQALAGKLPAAGSSGNLINTTA